jgi:hypothetical protein
VHDEYGCQVELMGACIIIVCRVCALNIGDAQ